MVVILVVDIRVPAPAGPFFHRPKGQLAQTADLAHDDGIGVIAVQINGLAVGGAAQSLAVPDLAFQQLAVFRMGDGLGFRDKAHLTLVLLGQAVDMFFEQFGHRIGL